MCGEQTVEITALVGDRTTKSFFSATTLLSASTASICVQRTPSFFTNEKGGMARVP